MFLPSVGRSGWGKADGKSQREASAPSFSYPGSLLASHVVLFRSIAIDRISPFIFPDPFPYARLAAPHLPPSSSSSQRPEASRDRVLRSRMETVLGQREDTTWKAKQGNSFRVGMVGKTFESQIQVTTHRIA